MNIGIDLVDINRIKKIYKKYKKNFLNKILTENEIAIIETISNEKRKIEKLAGIFALKEAVIKCLNKKSSFKEICIYYDKSGKPNCKIKNNQIILSLSHEKNYAVAIAIIFDYKNKN